MKQSKIMNKFLEGSKHLFQEWHLMYLRGLAYTKPGTEHLHEFGKYISTQIPNS